MEFSNVIDLDFSDSSEEYVHVLQESLDSPIKSQGLQDSELPHFSMEQIMPRKSGQFIDKMNEVPKGLEIDLSDRER